MSEAAVVTATGGRPAAGAPLLAALVVWALACGLLFFDTVLSMVVIWQRSQTFAHGFLIAPISLWLVWRQRDQLATAVASPQPLALSLVLGGGMVWLLAHSVDVQVIQQLAFVAVLVSGFWVILGTRLAARVAFPLGFLFLAVPMGGELIPPLMELTAYTTELMVRASGVPVYREGMFLSLPTGNWSVIAECSGVRYLIASFTLGLIYAHLTYYSYWRRAAFVLASIVVPIVANSLRAYGVVMLGHLSDMRLGVGVDHLVYGWGFFGLVMLLLFWLGGLWQDVAPADADHAPAPQSQARASLPRLLACAVLALAAAALWPAIALTLDRGADQAVPPPLLAPAAAPGWKGAQQDAFSWRPGQTGADRELDQVYGSQPAVGVFLRQYLQQRQGSELVDTTDPWRPDRKTWRVAFKRSVVIELDGPLQIEEAELVSDRSRLLVWSWYRVDGEYTANPYVAKLLEARQQLWQGRRQGTRVFLATALDRDREETAAREALQAFLDAHVQALEATLDTGVGSGGN